MPITTIGRSASLIDTERNRVVILKTGFNAPDAESSVKAPGPRGRYVPTLDRTRTSKERTTESSLDEYGLTNGASADHAVESDTKYAS